MTAPRWLINGFLVAFLAVLAIDAFRPINDAHEALKEDLNTPLVWTGLWQGPWRLYGPEVDKVNLRFRADVVFADGEAATWASPEWQDVSSLRKFLGARHVNYFGYLVRADEPAWRALCAYLARTVRHPAGRDVAVVQVTLSIAGALIPPPSERVLPLGPYLTLAPWDVLTVWRPAA